MVMNRNKLYFSYYYPMKQTYSFKNVFLRKFPRYLGPGLVIGNPTKRSYLYLYAIIFGHQVLSRIFQGRIMGKCFGPRNLISYSEAQYWFDGQK